jgi:undecaprenyl-diphosphatase
MLENLDLWLMQKLNVEWTNAFLDRLLPTLTNLAAWLPVIVAAVACALFFGGTRARLLVATLAVAIGLGDGLVSNTLKNAVGRLRPRDSSTEVVARALPKAKPQILAVFQAPVIKQGQPAKPGSRGKSFPSSHTINVVSAATVCLIVLGRRVWWAALLAALVSWSRVYCGDHWPSDLAGSIPLGLLVGWCSARLIDWLWRTQGMRLFPGAHRSMPRLLANP